MSRQFTRKYDLEVARGNISGVTSIHKFGRNPDIDQADGFEAIWNGGGDYTGQDATVAETLETFSSSANDAGTLLSSGTATGGSSTTLVDSGANFSGDGVAAGDVLINDTQLDHGIVTSVTATTITVARMEEGSINAASDTYRVATQASTGTPVMKLHNLLDSAYAETSEYIILNGVTGVDTVGTYLRHSRAKCHGGTNAGEITTRQKTTTANVTMILPVGYNTTMIAAYTVPAGKHVLFTDWFAALSKKQTGFSNLRLMFRPVGDVFQVLEETTISSAGSSYLDRGFTIPKGKIPEMSDIKIMADTSVDNNGVAGGFDIYVIDN